MSISGHKYCRNARMKSLDAAHTVAASYVLELFTRDDKQHASCMSTFAHAQQYNRCRAHSRSHCSFECLSISDCLLHSPPNLEIVDEF